MMRRLFAPLRQCGWILSMAAALLMPAGAALAKCLPIAEAPARVLPAAAPAAGSVRLTFLGSYTKFENFSPEVFAAGGDNYDS